MGDQFDIKNMLHDLTAGHVRMVQAGAEAERNRISGIVAALEREYRKAQTDEKARLPTSLSLAIEAMLAMKPQGASPFAERRMKPRDDEMTTFGAKLVAGS